MAPLARTMKFITERNASATPNFGKLTLTLGHQEKYKAVKEMTGRTIRDGRKRGNRTDTLCIFYDTANTRKAVVKGQRQLLTMSLAGEIAGTQRHAYAIGA